MYTWTFPIVFTSVVYTGFGNGNKAQAGGEESNDQNAGFKVLSLSQARSLNDADGSTGIYLFALGI